MGRFTGNDVAAVPQADINVALETHANLVADMEQSYNEVTHWQDMFARAKSGNMISTESRFTGSEQVVSVEGVADKLRQVGKIFIEKIKKMFAWINDMLKKFGDAWRTAKLRIIQSSIGRMKGNQEVVLRNGMISPLAPNDYVNLLHNLKGIEAFADGEIMSIVNRTGFTPDTTAKMKEAIVWDVRKLKNTPNVGVTVPGAFKLEVSESSPMVKCVRVDTKADGVKQTVDRKKIEAIYNTYRDTARGISNVDVRLQKMLNAKDIIVRSIAKEYGVTDEGDIHGITREWLSVTTALTQALLYANSAIGNFAAMVDISANQEGAAAV